MAGAQNPLGRLHSKDPVDAAWRAQQANIDADIEGLARDPQADELMAQMDAEGLDAEQQIARLKVYFIACRDKIPSAP
jgi:hypothetical protein